MSGGYPFGYHLTKLRGDDGTPFADPGELDHRLRESHGCHSDVQPAARAERGLTTTRATLALRHRFVKNRHTMVKRVRVAIGWAGREP
jgi:hypothetical protein